MRFLPLEFMNNKKVMGHHAVLQSDVTIIIKELFYFVKSIFFTGGDFSQVYL